MHIAKAFRDPASALRWNNVLSVFSCCPFASGQRHGPPGSARRTRTRCKRFLLPIAVFCLTLACLTVVFPAYNAVSLRSITTELRHSREHIHHHFFADREKLYASSAQDSGSETDPSGGGDLVTDVDWQDAYRSRIRRQNSEARDSGKSSGVGVQVWMPHSSRCANSFALRAPSQLPGDKPALVVRDAVVDFRHVSVREYRRRKSTRPYRRVLVLLSALPHGKQTLVEKPHRPSKTPRHGSVPGFTARIVNSDATVAGVLNNESRTEGVSRDGALLKAGVDFVITDKHCSTACAVYGKCRVKEWQLVVTLVPNSPTLERSDAVFAEALEHAADEGAAISIDMPIDMRSGRVEMFTLRIPLTCIGNLISETALPYSPLMPPRHEICSDARGAVAISGGPLFGAKRLSREGWREVAHFAARALFGRMWFDTAVVGVNVNYTMSQIMHICDTNLSSSQRDACIRWHFEDNRSLLRAIADEVENEFTALGVPASDWSRLVLLPSCRLGSDFNGSEDGVPCGDSHHHGQKLVGHSAYTVFAPYHRWASNIDLDEFIVDESMDSTDKVFAADSRVLFSLDIPRSKHTSTAARRFESAATRFQTIIANSKQSSIRLPWKDFRVLPNQTRALSYLKMVGDDIHHRGFGSESDPSSWNETKCYMGSWGRRDLSWGGGKVAQHCYDGLGFMVHDPWNLWMSRKQLNLEKVGCTPRLHGWPPESSLRTYHARGLEPRYGQCAFFVPTNSEHASEALALELDR